MNSKYFECNLSLLYECNLRKNCSSVAIAYLLLIILRIYETVWTLIAAQEPVSPKEIYLILVPIGSHLTLLLTLFIGILKENHKCFIPWLAIMGAIFLAALSYALMYIQMGDLKQIIINIICVSIMWYCWIIVFFYFLYLRKLSTEIIYKKLNQNE